MSAILETQMLTKSYGGLMVTNQCDFTVEKGELHALIGPNGAGKTTLIHQISGVVKPDSGTILFNGRNITNLPMYRRVHLGLARTYQVTNIFKKYTVLDNLVLAVQAQNGTSFRFWKPVHNEKYLYEQAAEIVERIGLGGRKDIIAGELAHGEQRQLEVGIALASKPKLLLLDEPTAGMGLEESALIVELIAEINKDVTILLVEHDMDAVFQLADRISVLVYGTLIATDRPEAIRENKEVQNAYLGDEVQYGSA